MSVQQPSLQHLLAEPVVTIRAVTHNTGRLGTFTASDNHWTIYLLLDTRYSIQINMSNDGEDVSGELRV